MEPLYQGAEARLFKVELFGEPAVLKERFEKKYRHPALEARLTKVRKKEEEKEEKESTCLVCVGMNGRLTVVSNEDEACARSTGVSASDQMRCGCTSCLFF